MLGEHNPSTNAPLVSLCRASRIRLNPPPTAEATTRTLGEPEINHPHDHARSSCAGALGTVRTEYLWCGGHHKAAAPATTHNWPMMPSIQRQVNETPAGRMQSQQSRKYVCLPLGQFLFLAAPVSVCRTAWTAGLMRFEHKHGTKVLTGLASLPRIGGNADLVYRSRKTLASAKVKSEPS